MWTCMEAPVQKGHEMLNRAVLVISMALACGGCMTLMGIKQVPLVHSSLDTNGGSPHSAMVAGSDVQELVRMITTLGEKRGLVLVEKKCVEASECRLVYKRNPESKSKTVGSGTVSGYGSHESSRVSGSSSTSTYNLEFSSRIFVSVRKQKHGISTEMIGVPVVNGNLSCPPLLETRGVCKAQPFNVQGEQTPAESFRGIWGVDISGKEEAEIISGILAELETV